MKITHFIASSVMSIAISTSVASAAPIASEGSATTTVRFNNAFTSILRSFKIRLSKFGESKPNNNAIRFPIIEGILDSPMLGAKSNIPAVFGSQPSKHSFNS